MNIQDAEYGALSEAIIENGPSADFICAISEFLDTDPQDLLVELGYYRSDMGLESETDMSER